MAAPGPTTYEMKNPGMPACARSDGDKAVGALINGLLAKRVVNDVMQDDAAIGVNGLIDIHPRAQRGDHHRYLVLNAQGQILLEPVIALVDDLIDRERRRRRIGMGAIIGRQFFGDLGQPLIQLRDRPGVQRREGSHYARLALRDHQFRI